MAGRLRSTCTKAVNDYRDGFHDYVFSFDPNDPLDDGGAYDVRVDGFSVALFGVPSEFCCGGGDLFGFTPFQSGGGGSVEEFYIHDLSLHEGPAGPPSSPPTDFSWDVDAARNWETPGSWTAGGPPGLDGAVSANHTATFGNIITRSRTVSSDTALTMRAITFDNSNTYAIAGTGSLSLVQGTANGAPGPSLTVVQGHHQFQLNVSLQHNATADVASGSTLTFNNVLDLGGNTLTKTGAGELAINNVLNSGGGALICDEGVCSGTGTIGGDVTNNGGAISPGLRLPGQSPVPEPAGLLLLVIGSALVLVRRR